MITQLKFVGTSTTDQDRALEFYTERSAFALSTDQVFEGRQRWIELRIANQRLAPCFSRRRGMRIDRDLFQRLVRMR